LAWLPPEIPANIRLIVSTLPGKPQEEAGRRQWQTLTVELLIPGERREWIRKYLQQYRKELSLGQVNRIAESRQAANPLFLRAMLDELPFAGFKKNGTFPEFALHRCAAFV
jgi:hypothetical protein